MTDTRKDAICYAIVKTAGPDLEPSGQTVSRHRTLHRATAAQRNAIYSGRRLDTCLVRVDGQEFSDGEVMVLEAGYLKITKNRYAK